MLDNTIRDSIDQLDNAMNARRFLLSTPFSNDPYLNWNNRLTPSFFFDNLYFDSDDAKDVKKEILEKILLKEARIFLLTGFKGCGKSTFIQYFFSHVKALRPIMFDFEKIYFTKNPIQEYLVLYFYNLINEDCEREKLITKKMVSVFFNADNKKFMDKYVDPSNYIKSFYNSCEKLINKEQVEAVDYEQVKSALNLLTINQLLMLIVFWSLSERIVFNAPEKGCIIFESLDAVYDTDSLYNLMEEFTVFINNTNFIIDNLTSNELTKRNYNAFQDFSFIFVMRETTKAKLLEHFNDRSVNQYTYFDFSTVYPKEEIINTRNDFLKSNNDIQNEPLKTSVDNINRICNDDYIKKNIFPLFNNDYRTSVEVLTYVCEKKPEIISECIELINSSYKIEKRGFRNILLRCIFDLFKEKQYFDLIKQCEFSVPLPSDSQLTIKPAANISRLLLTYLRNYVNEYYKKAYLIEKPSVCLYTIFKDFENICDLEFLVQSIWQLFALKDKEYWNHLITFDALSVSSSEHLFTFLEKYKNNGLKFHEYPYIRISCSGQIYFDLVLTSFEYYASRFVKGKPLFCISNFTKINNSYIFERIIDKVFTEVQKCCVRLNNFQNRIFTEKLGFTNDDYLGSKFAFHKLSEDENGRVNAMFHSERIIHEHISYLDSYRQFAFNHFKRNVAAKVEVNKIIIAAIEKYIDLTEQFFDGYKINVSDQTPTLVRRYRYCINRIKGVTQDYKDFETSIDNATGSLLESTEGHVV